MAESASVATAPLVLVADDEGSIRDFISEVLAEAGFRTVTAGDGEEVLHLARQHQPVLIVLDVMMPRMDGYTALTRLRGHPMTAQVPVIILTGHMDAMYQTISAGVGAVAHVTKPFSPRQLTETVWRVLGGRPA